MKHHLLALSLDRANELKMRIAENEKEIARLEEFRVYPPHKDYEYPLEDITRLNSYIQDDKLTLSLALLDIERLERASHE